MLSGSLIKKCRTTDQLALPNISLSSSDRQRYCFLMRWAVKRHLRAMTSALLPLARQRKMPSSDIELGVKYLIFSTHSEINPLLLAQVTEKRARFRLPKAPCINPTLMAQEKGIAFLHFHTHAALDVSKCKG